MPAETTSCPPFVFVLSPPLYSARFFLAGTESQEFAERPAVFDTYVGNDRNSQPMKFESERAESFVVLRGWIETDGSEKLSSITIRNDRWRVGRRPPTRHLLRSVPAVIARLLENIIISNR